MASKTTKTPFVAGGTKLVVKFTADWCGPCKRIQPDFEDLADDYTKEGVTFFLFDVDDGIKDQSNEEILKAYPFISEIYPGTITSIPAFAFFRDGKHVDTLGWDRKKIVTLLEREFMDEPNVTFEEFKSKLTGEPLVKPKALGLEHLSVSDAGEPEKEESDLEVNFSGDEESEDTATESVLPKREESKPLEDAVDSAAEISGVSDSDESDGEKE